MNGRDSREGSGLTGGPTIVARVRPPRSGRTNKRVEEQQAGGEMNACESGAPALSRTPLDRLADSRGTSLPDLLVVLTAIAMVSGMAFASVEHNVKATRETGAARAFAMRVRQTRLEAV